MAKRENSVTDEHHIPKDKIYDRTKIYKNWFRFFIGHILKDYVPELAWFKDHLPEHLSHSFMEYTKKRSEVVSKGNTGIWVTTLANDKKCWNHYTNTLK